MAQQTELLDRPSEYPTSVMLPPPLLVDMFARMIEVQVLDRRMVALQRQGRIHFYVPSTGEEAVQIGTALALRPDDWVFPQYREQGVALGRGYPLRELLCQLIGNREDTLKGRQMPNHFGSYRHRFAVASSPVGTQIPHAVGAAWSARLRREDSVAVAYFGDGATSTGDFHAGMTIAGVQRLPVLFICKNNAWAISTPVAKQTAARRLVDKAIGYGVRGVRQDGNDVARVYQTTLDAIERARSGEGPTFIELVTYRTGPHTTADDPARYRTALELEAWRERDPIDRARRMLQEAGLHTDEMEQALRAKADEAITRVLQEVERLPAPPPESLFEDVYVEMPWHLAEQQRELSGAAQSGAGEQRGG